MSVLYGDMQLAVSAACYSYPPGNSAAKGALGLRVAKGLLIRISQNTPDQLSHHTKALSTALKALWLPALQALLCGNSHALAGCLRHLLVPGPAQLKLALSSCYEYPPITSIEGVVREVPPLVTARRCGLNLRMLTGSLRCRCSFCEGMLAPL